MRRSVKIAALFALGMNLAGCGASAELGFDPATNTIVTRQTGGYKIACAEGAEFCMIRAEAICGGPNYQIAGRPSASPQVQALVNGKMATLNTNNPYVLHIVCD